MGSAEERYTKLTEAWLEEMRRVPATKEEFLEGLRAALGELEVELQAAKETME